jgi:membrane protease YdiL (CAAX protease family)
VPPEVPPGADAAAPKVADTPAGAGRSEGAAGAGGSDAAEGAVPVLTTAEAGAAPPAYKRIWIRFIQFHLWTIVFLVALAIPFGFLVHMTPALRGSIDTMRDSVDHPIMAPVSLMALGAVLLATRRIRRAEGLSWAAAGLGRSRIAGDLVLGFAIGLASFSLIPLAAAALGAADLQMAPWSAATLRSLALALAGLLCASAFEEVMDRGITLTLFARRSATVGVIVTSLWFAVQHLPNPGGSHPIAFFEVFAAGAVLAIARLRSGALWLPIGWHAAWNFAQGWFYGCVVSGMPAATAPFLETTFEGPDLVTGGRFGPESSILAPIVELVTLIAFLRLYKPRRPSAGPSEEVSGLRSSPGSS